MAATLLLLLHPNQWRPGLSVETRVERAASVPFYGWRVVGAAFVVALFAWGTSFYAQPVMMQAFHASRGWPIAAISGAITAHYLLGALFVIPVPELQDRFGLARVTAAGAAMTALGLLAWAEAPEPWALYVAAVISAAGWAALGLATINAIIARWFDRGRPAALGHALNGASVAGVLFTPLWAAGIARLGLPAMSALVGFATIAIVGTLAATVLRHTPASLGQEMDGSSIPPATVPAPRPAGPLATPWASPGFISLVAAYTLGLFGQVGLLAHLVARLAPALGAEGAALAVSGATACAVAGRVALGWLPANADRRALCGLTLLVQAAGVALLLASNSPLAVLSGCLLFGIGIGVLITLPPLIIQAEGDPRLMARLVARCTAVSQACAGFAPAIFGALRDATEGYAAAFIAAMLCQLAGATILLATRRKKSAATA